MRLLSQTSALALCVLVLISAATVEAQMADPLIGTWNMNIEKSTSTCGVMLPRSSTRTFEDWGDGLRLARTDGVNAQGQPLGSRVVFRRDGRSYPVSNMAPTGLIAAAFTIKSMEPFVVEYRAGLEGKFGPGVSTETVSPDGTTYMVEIQTIDPKGQPCVTNQVWERP